MPKRVLVAHASRHGGTAEIADRIGEVLREAGLDAEVRPVAQVGELNGYRAVVLGAAVYMGSWSRGAGRFLRSHRYGLSAMPVWLFSSGPTGEAEPDGPLYPSALAPVINHIHPRDVASFHGKIDPSGLNAMERLVIRTVHAETGDFREWDSIEQWAREIAAALHGRSAQAPAFPHAL